VAELNGHPAVGQGRLAGQVAIVTGGAGGIGQATAVALEAEGAHVAIVDLHHDQVTSALRQLARPADHLGLVLDVRHETDMEQMARQTLSRFGRIDILVTCAGIVRPSGSGPKMLADMQPSEWDVVVDTNLKGVFLSNRAVVPSMIAQRRGAIINVASVAGREGRAYDSAYCASKFGVIGLSEALADEVRQHNVRVQTLLPDAVDTPMLDQSRPFPRPAHVLPPMRVAQVAVYLLMLPEDTILVNPIVAPFQARRRRTTVGKE
jgi:NAD(P)-dependent dehydrogenase (short-subunit alcohol dehydrogenase family)